MPEIAEPKEARECADRVVPIFTLSAIVILPPDLTSQRMLHSAPSRTESVTESINPTKAFPAADAVPPVRESNRIDVDLPMRTEDLIDIELPTVHGKAALILL